MKRNKTIDISRGMAILFIIFMHCAPPKPIVYFISSFSVPLFFIISGYLFSIKEESFVGFVKKKANRFLIPYLCLGTIIFVYQSIKDWILDRNGFPIGSYMIKFVLQQRYTSLWFVTCLFIASILFWLILKICKKDILLSGIICSSSLIAGLLYCRVSGPVLFWNVDVSLVALFYLWVGYYIKSKHVLDRIVYRNNLDCLLKSMVCFTICAILVYLSGRTTGSYLVMANSSYGFELFTIPASILGSLGTYLLAICIKKGRAQSFMRHVGIYSMVYFAFNQSIMYMTLSWILNKVGMTTMEGFPGLMRSVLAFVLVLILLYPVERIINGTSLRFMSNGFHSK